MYVVPGSMLTSSLRIVRPLKEGGVGNLWVGEDLAEGKHLAVKFLSEEAVRLSPEALKRFQREAKAAIGLRGPHIVQTFDFGTMEDGTPYIVMELLEGESLGERLDRAGAMHPRQVASVMDQVAEALQTAHDQGLVHRDIKPDNIFLVGQEAEASTAPPFVKVLDFGTVKQIQQRSDSLLTATGMIVGTPEYMSPEQVFAAKDIDHRADIWGLGAVAYHALTGKLPFEADSPHALVLTIANAELRPPSAVNPQLPAVVDAWFRRAMARSPSDRYDSATEAAQAFAQAVAGAGPPIADESSFEDEATLRFQPGIHPDPAAPDPHPSTPGVGAPDGAPPAAPSDPRLSVPPPPDPRLSVPPSAGLTAPQLTPGAPTVETALMAATQPAALGVTTHARQRSSAEIKRWLLVGGVVVGAMLVLSLVAALLLVARAEDETTDGQAGATDGASPAGAPTAPNEEDTIAAEVSTEHSAAATESAVAPADGEEPEPAPAGAADAGSLPGYATIVCIPACDQVIVHGRALGPSPVQRTPLPPGKHEVTLRRAGVPEKKVDIEIRADQLSSHRIGMD